MLYNFGGYGTPYKWGRRVMKNVSPWLLSGVAIIILILYNFLGKFWLFSPPLMSNDNCREWT